MLKVLNLEELFKSLIYSIIKFSQFLFYCYFYFHQWPKLCYLFFAKNLVLCNLCFIIQHCATQTKKNRLGSKFASQIAKLQTTETNLKQQQSKPKTRRRRKEGGGESFLSFFYQIEHCQNFLSFIPSISSRSVVFPVA